MVVAGVRELEAYPRARRSPLVVRHFDCEPPEEGFLLRPGGHCCLGLAGSVGAVPEWQ